MRRFAYLTAAAWMAGMLIWVGAAQACGTCGQHGEKAAAATHDDGQTEAVVLTVAGTAEKADKCAATGAKADCAKCPAADKADCAACPVADKADCPPCEACPAGKQAGVSLPAMTYRVGEQDYAQYGPAVAAAAEQGAAVRYVIGEQTFEDKLAAKAALADVTEAQLAAVLEAHPGAADAAAAVFASYQVGEQSICCEKMAQMAAEKDGQPVQYVIDGQQTSCAVTARLLTAQAKLRAAGQAAAAAAAQPQAEPSAAVERPATGS